MQVQVVILQLAKDLIIFKCKRNKRRKKNARLIFAISAIAIHISLTHLHHILLLHCHLLHLLIIFFFNLFFCLKRLIYFG